MRLIHVVRDRVERLTGLRVFRTTLPHGVDLSRDLGRRFDLRSWRMIFDVGANEGQTAVQFRRWFPEATIVCFEPVPDTFARLAAVAARLGGVKALPIALAARPGRAPMRVEPDSRRSALATVSGSGGESVVQLEVEVSTVARVAQEMGAFHIDLLKVDAEGSDLEVLLGADSLLKARAITAVLAEVGFGVSPIHVPLEAVDEYLHSHGMVLHGFYEQAPGPRGL